ncbi:MAG: DegV family protein [Lachnospiraceae bacterium]|nr:DegV family protein [Lachnospiraceae bacterium]
MNDYVIMTDSGCDISPQTLKDWGIKCVDLTFRNVNSNQTFSNGDVAISDFYAEMRNGTVFQTSAINPEEYKEAFLEELKNGKDVIYIALSSGLSVTSNSAQMAALDLSEEGYFKRIAVVDSLCASSGQGLLLYLAVQKKNEGADFATTVKYLEDTVLKICHWFTVDDLKYLKRGGRISAASAFAATVLDIKPVMHMDDEGHLIAVSKVRGRKQALKAMAEKYQSLAEDPMEGIYFISQGDCMEDALMLEEMICKKNGKKASYIADIGPVIGSHSGPGTLALFFIGKER